MGAAGPAWDFQPARFRWEGWEPDPNDVETVVRLCLRGVGDATEVSFSQGEFATEDRLALHLNGWTDAFEKLRDLIGSRS